MDKIWLSWNRYFRFILTCLYTCMLSCFSCVWLLATPWTVAHQAPLFMEYWSGLSFPPPGDLPKPGIKTASLISPAWVGGFFTTSVTQEAPPYLLRILIKISSLNKKKTQNEDSDKMFISFLSQQYLSNACWTRNLFVSHNFKEHGFISLYKIILEL